MDWSMLAWVRLADAAAGGLIALAVGSLAALLCRQPVRRSRIVVLTLIGGIAVPCLGALSIAPAWSAGLLPPVAHVTVPDKAAATRISERLDSRASSKPLRRDGRRVDSLPPTDRAHASRTAASPMPPAQGRGPSSRALLLASYLAVAAAYTAWWLMGQFLVWRVTQAAHAAPEEVRDAFHRLAGPGGEHVRLLESGGISLPFTYTWLRPVILLPTALCRGNDPDALRYALAHEWSHVERRDAWAWNLASLAGLLLFYQPLFWWLRRQLRLSQDYLADARAAAAGSPEDYAAFLVRLARTHASDPSVAALGIVDRRSNLSRRVMMLVLDHEPLERRCRAAWSFSAVVAAIAVIVIASGLRLSSAASPEDRAVTKEAKATDVVAPKVEGARTWTGRVTERGTGKPVAGADVVVEISTSRDKTTNDFKTLRNVPQKSGPHGGYEFTITPEEAAERFLYITLHVNARDHVSYFGGYSYSMILKNEKLGERPFFENLELAPGKAIEAVVMTPGGQPAAAVKIQSFSTPNSHNIFDQGRFQETKTDAQGHFRLVFHPEGTAVFWLLPQDYAPETHGLKNNLRGDLGSFTLTKGVVLRGRLLDTQGKPVGGVYVEADLEDKEGDDTVPSGIADQIHRATLTAPDGTFTFRPLPAGVYRVYTTEQGWDPSTRDGAHDPERRPLPAVFTPRKVTLKEDEAPGPVEIRAVPHVVVEAQLYNSKGEKQSGHEVSLVGDIDGEFWTARCQSTSDGAYRFIAPHGLEDAQIMLMTNEHSALQCRLAKDAPLQHRRNIKLGTLDHDVRGIEIIRYVAPIILISATTRDGKPVKNLKVSVDYTKPDPDPEGKFILKNGARSDVSLNEQADGKFRTSQLVPDHEVEVTAQAEGFNSASRKLSLPEGKNEEVTFVLEPK